MKYQKAHPEQLNMSAYQGYAIVEYDKLVELFGEPERFQEGKVQAEWLIEFDDGVVASIYDWKEDIKPEAVKIWHVGGHEKHALWNVLEMIKK